MSLNRYHQPLQNPDDFKQSGVEIQGLHQLAQGNAKKSPIVSWFWDRWGTGTTNNGLAKMQPQPEIPFGQYFVVANERKIDSSALCVQGGCCKDCAPKSSNAPWSCYAIASPSAQCKPGPLGPTTEYLYNGVYYCCQQSPFGSPAPYLQQLRAQNDSRSTQAYIDQVPLATGQEKMKTKTRAVTGAMYEKQTHQVSTRIGTS
jgi:hypothetical protein